MKNRPINPIKYELDENGCHICTSHRCSNSGKGYPSIAIKGKYWTLSRYIYTINKGEIPKGLLIRHTCDNKKCINPSHLILGTCKDNKMDSVSRNRHVCAEKVKTAKLSKEIVIEIFTSNLSNVELSKKYDISNSVVSSIRRRKSWKSVTKNLPDYNYIQDNSRKVTNNQIIEIFNILIMESEFVEEC